MPCKRSALIDCRFACLIHGFCRNTRTPLVTDDELDDSEFIRDLRATTFDEGVSDSEWHEHVTALYRDMRGWVENTESDGDKEVFLDMEEFEIPSIREWFRDFCCTPCPPEVTPRVRPEARERVRVLATILRATYPVRASLWGVRAANLPHPPQRRD